MVEAWGGSLGLRRSWCGSCGCMGRGDVQLGLKVVQQGGDGLGGGGGAEHVEVGADEHGVRVVLGQPRGEAPVAVAYAVGRSPGQAKRPSPRGCRAACAAGGRDVRTGRRRRRSAGSHHRRRRRSVLSRPARSTTPWTLSVPASGSGSPMGWWSSAGGQRRELERRWRSGGAQHRVALGSRLWVELAEDLAQLDREPDHRLVLRLSLGVDGVQQPLGSEAAQHEVELPGQRLRRRAARSTSPDRGTAGSGGRRRRPAARAPGASGRRASSGTRRRCCGSAGRPLAGTTAGAATRHDRDPRSQPPARRAAA